MYPGDLPELDFVEAYARSTLRKPEAAADAALGRLVFAEAGDRAILAGLIGLELAEACRRLVAVHGALFDRTYPVARTLSGPLPGLDAWRAFTHRIATASPEQMLRDLALSDLALESARDLRSQPSLPDLDGLVAAAGSANPMLILPPGTPGGIAAECWFSGSDASGQVFTSAFAADEGAAASLADLTADLCRIARGFLLDYVRSRRGAGWRGDR